MQKLDEKTTNNCKIFILVHGAWHGSWCWENITNLLKKVGHTVYALDLPGHYNNPADLTNINLTSYVQYVTNFIKKIDKKVVLVGHSMAGVVVSQVAEDIGEQISKLIYISAFVPDKQGSLIHEEEQSTTRGVTPEVIFDEPGNRIIITQSTKLKELFYNTCSDEYSAYAIDHLNDQPLKPFIDNVALSTEKFGQINKVYIECLRDNAIHISDQRRMHQKLNCEVISLDCDHSPFFSCPQELADILIENS